MSLNTKLQLGLEYEKYVQKIIKNKYINCWLWSEVPKHILVELKIINNNQENCDDIGCDIICQNNDLTFLFMQCKNYSTTGNDNTISIHDLSGFYNFIAETGFNGSVYYSGKLSSQIICRKKRINYINLPYITNNQILDFLPRDYQIEAYNYIKNNNKNILSMPCGTGKTFVSFLLSLEYNNIIILTPLISTTEQIHTHYKNYYSKYENINFVLVNCKAERNINNITIKDKNVISSTYDSCDIINKLLLKIDNPLIIIDEFHNLSNDMMTNHKSEMNKLIINNKNILFMSATPLKSDLLTNNIYELTWEDAIKNKYICDYNFYYPDNDKIITKINDIKFDKTIINKTILINKVYFLLDAIKLTKVIKCIVYLKTIQEMNEFVKIVHTINLYFELNIKIYEINYKTSAIIRNKNLIKFKNDNSCINILCNVHIIDEGIDIPECDSIYLTHPNNNVISIIQRISRANRLDKNNTNKIAKIFVWSKNEIKLESITKNISKFIDCKYGKENNECINYKKSNENEILKNNDNFSKIDNQIVNFIKNNSNIPHNFIDTFFTKFKIGGELDFDIQDTNVSKYLGISLINLRKRLNNAYSKTKRFIENVDYIRIKTGISNNINYMLNYACFEKLAMSGDSKQSEVVRMYFTKLREFITDNQRVIYQAMNKKNDLKIYNKMDTIYFFAADERKQDILKVGKSTKIVERLRNYNVGRIKEVELKYVALVKNPLLIEKCIKLLLKKKQVFSGKELFEIDPKILKKVIDECYCKHVSAKDNKDLYDEISNLLGMYVYVKDKLNIKPYIIIGKNL